MRSPSRSPPASPVAIRRRLVANAIDRELFLELLPFFTIQVDLSGIQVPRPRDAADEIVLATFVAARRIGWWQATHAILKNDSCHASPLSFGHEIEECSSAHAPAISDRRDLRLDFQRAWSTRAA